MNDKEELFPKFQKNIENLIEDEDGSISGKKLLFLGTMAVILSSLFSMDVFAKHRSHRSHRSHSSHRSSSHGNSHSNHSNHASHSDHGSHDSHDSHQSHVSHTSHSNTASHSNSLYSAEGDVTYSAPAAYSIPEVNPPQPVETTENTFVLPNVDENIGVPNGTPGTSVMASLTVPSTTVNSKVDVGDLNDVSPTDKIE